MQRGPASHRARSPFLPLAAAGPGHALFYRGAFSESRGFQGCNPPVPAAQNGVPAETRLADLQATKPQRASHDVGQNWRLWPPDQAGFLGIAWFCHFLLCLLPWEGRGVEAAGLEGGCSFRVILWSPSEDGLIVRCGVPAPLCPRNVHGACPPGLISAGLS